jgi:hypothetical protein
MVLLSVSFTLSAAEKRSITIEDALKFRSLRSPSISNDGKWVAYSEELDRGDGRAVISSTERDTSITVERGSRPLFSEDGKWAAMALLPKALELENLEKGKEKPKNGMVIANLIKITTTTIENVESFTFSNDSKWLAYKISPEKKGDEKKIIGQDLALRHLESGSELIFQYVTEYAFDSTSAWFAYIVAEPRGERNGVYAIDMKSGNMLPIKITGKANANYSSLNWTHHRYLLGFVSSEKLRNDEPDDCQLKIWAAKLHEMIHAVDSANTPKGYFIPFKNELKWSIDGSNLYFGLKPLKDSSTKEEKIKYVDSNFYSTDLILKKTEGDVWHWKDGRIKSNEKNWYSKNKDNTFLAYYNPETNRLVQLADDSLPEVEYPLNSQFTVGINPKPYLSEIQWDDDYYDLYAVNLASGERKLIMKKLSSSYYLSPAGNFIVYYYKKGWRLYDCRLDTTYFASRGIDYPLYDEDWDMPSEPQPYGFGGWLENDAAFLIYDRYDIWKINTHNGFNCLSLTAGDGRISQVNYRIKNIDPDKKYYKKGDNIYISGFHEKTKESDLATIGVEILGSETLLHDKKKFNLIGKAKNANMFLYSRQAYNEYPDVWVADSTFRKPRKISNLNSQVEEYFWGDTEVFDYTSLKGDTLQGFVIKPENFDPKKKYPVIVCFYERYSDAALNFFTPKASHWPIFPMYSADGYLILFPDIKYEAGSPGASAYNCIIPAVRKLAAMGMADTNAVGLWGHSWSGYQTAFLITQTNFFKAAVAGATVGNMTSAYSGIRTESGRARQMQYEKFQSRIGGTLWDSLSSYIRNSPVFFANKANTPLLLMAGDEDQMVPWQQSIEIFLAWKRLNKNCIFLQYHGEPHWPMKLPNRIDYAMKMKEFYDTYLLHKPAPDWIEKGVELKK